MVRSINHSVEPIALRVNDAARVTGLSRGTLYKLLNSGKLKTVKVAGRRLFLREDLLALLTVETDGAQSKTDQSTRS